MKRRTKSSTPDPTLHGTIFSPLTAKVIMLVMVEEIIDDEDDGERKSGAVSGSLNAS